ncbi:LamG-like jellyroll fold domain-containing protein [Endozoicomonas acroporae]|uniref:LamG-like jellyroll fold domain-containing protein n=1 Tax=Endozoicomonas acroporae TaxID=1701104 RepID=UPI0019D66DBE|nr:LamG-like jellyroll fold domain-containing protein [Endozoicomonas acroporae]
MQAFPGADALAAFALAGGSGDVAADLTDHGHQLTFNSGVTHSDSGVQLNSAGGSIGSLTLDGAMTIATTFTYHSHTAWARMVDLGNGAGTDNILIASPSEGRIEAQIFHGGTIVGSVAFDNFFSLDETFHLALTVDADGHLHLYKNGVEVADNPGQGPAGVELTSNLVGASNWPQDTATDGTIKDLMILDSTLSASDISELYQLAQSDDLQSFVTPLGINESAQPGTVVGQVSASDANGDSLTFSLTDDADGMFAIDAATGEISVLGVLDYNTASSYPLTVRVADSYGAFSEQQYTVTVANVNEPPQLSQQPDPRALAMFDLTQGAGEVAENLGSHHQDLSFNSGINRTNDGVELNGAGGSLGDMTMGGDITIASTFTFDSHSNWARIVDLGNGAGADNILIASPSEGRIEAQIYHGNSVVGTVGLDDFYTLGETFHIALTVDNDGYMQLYKNGEQVAANPHGQTPVEMVRSSNLVGQSNFAQDAATNGTIKDLVILERSLPPRGISDLYDLTQSGEINEFLTLWVVDEKAQTGTVVGHVQASDVDSDTLTFSLTDDANGLFAINASSGEISVAGILDYNTANSHQLTVRVSDPEGAHSEQQYTVSVNATPELVPQLVSDTAAAFDFVDVVGDIVRDLGHHEHALTLNDGTEMVGSGVKLNSVGGSIETMTIGGDITIASTFTYHSHDTWARVVDLGNGAGADNILIASPSEGRIEAHILHGGTNVGIVAADNFYTLGEEFHVALTVDNDGHMRLYKNGVEVANNPDGQAPTEMSRSSNLVGLSNFSQDAATDGTINDLVILDTSMSPDDISDLYQSSLADGLETFLTALSIGDNASPGEVVGQVQAHDPEGNGLTFSLTDDAGGLFTIDSMTGEIKVAGVLDHNVASSHSLTVRVQDSHNDFTEQQYVVAVGNSPDIEPGRSSSLSVAAFEFNNVAGVYDDLTDHSHNVSFDSAASFESESVNLGGGGGSLGAMTLGGDFTIASTFSYSQFGSWARVVDFGNGPGADNILIASPSPNRIEAHVFRGGSMVGSVGLDNFYDLNEVFHIALTVEDNGHMRLYKNGVEVADNPNGQAPNEILRTSNKIGSSNFSQDAATDGHIYDLVVLNESLTADGIGEIYQQTQADQLSEFIDNYQALDPTLEHEQVLAAGHNKQYQVDIAAHPEGGYIATWKSGSGNSDDQVMAQRFDAAGNPVGNAHKVNTWNLSQAYGDLFEKPTVAVLPSGAYAVSYFYEDPGEITSSLTHFFRADGSWITRRHTDHQHYGTEVTALSDNRYAVSTVNSDYQLKVIMYDQNAQHTGDIFIANVDSDYSHPKLAALDNGKFAVNWRTSSGSDDAINLQIFNADGSSAHGPVAFGGHPASWGHDTQVIVLDNGGLATTYQSGNTWYIQMWSSNATAVGSPIAVSDSDVVALNNMQLTVVGNDILATFLAGDADGYGIYSRLFSSNGVPMTDPIAINDVKTGHQYEPSVTTLADGTVQIAWMSNQVDDADIYTKNLSLGQQIGENAQPGTIVGQVGASDPDGDAFFYSLTDSADGLFAIDASTGAISVAGALDYETATSHQLTVRVTDQTGAFDEQLFVVSLIDDQNVAPILLQDTDYSAVAAFDFADGSGLVSEDLTEHNLDLTFNNGITRTDDGVNLNSVGGSIGAMTLGGDMTIATTFTFHSHGNWARVVELSNGPSADNIIIASPSEGRIEANIYHGANMVGSVGFDNFYTLGETFHVALAIDDNGHMHLYKNGVEVADNPDAATPTVMARSSNLVGLSSFSQDAATDGSVKDLIIVDHFLEADHISDLYSLSQSGQIEVFLDPLHITENAAIGTEVGQVQAEDPEGNTLSFSLTDDAGGLFAIDAGTGVIRLAGDLNHTEASSHQVTVRVTDHPDGAFHEKQYEISVADHNYAPQFLPEGGSGALVAYDFAQGSGEVAEDLTYHNQDLTFNSGISRSGDGVALNSVGGSLEAMTLRGDITIASTFTYHSHSNWARLVDFGNGAGTDNILIASPSEGQIQAQIFHGNQIVGSVAFDNFYTLGETFHLALTVDDDGHIHLYKNGVQVADNPNGQGPSGVELTSNLVGQSNWSQDAATDGTVKDLVVFDRSLDPDSISDLYQQTQIGEVAAFLSVPLDTIAESALPGTVVGQALVSDVDGDNLTFSLTDDAGGLFAIDAATGEITVANTLDYDSASSHQLTVRVADPSGAFSEQTYVVALTAAPELLPERGSDALVAFDFANGSGEVAEDLTDHNQDLTFNSGITRSDDGVRLNSVGGSLGDLTLSGDMTIASTFTYHSHSPWARLVDLGNGAGTDNILIASPSEGRIEVQIFHGNNIVGSVAYDNFYTLDETFHLALTVDADGHMHLYKNGVEVADNPNGQGPAGVTLSSNLVGQSNWPQDTATDGTVKDLIILDRSLNPGSISDLFGQTQSGHIEAFLASADIVESAQPGDVVGQMQASDPAGEELTFSLTNNAGGLFTIDAATGEISLAGTLDYETATSHQLTVRATNSSGGFSEQPYVVSVTDVAELLPVHEANDALAAIDFTTGSGDKAESLTSNGQVVTFYSAITHFNHDGVSFNGAGGYLGTMTLSDDITIASTFTYDSHTNWARIIDFGNGPGTDNILIASPTEGRIEAQIFHGNTIVGSVAFDNFYTLGETFHMALTVDADGHMHLYKNGVEVADNPNGQGPSGVSLTSNLVGQSNWGAVDANTDGTMKDLVVLDRSLDPSSISDLYGQAQSGDIESFLTSLEMIGTESADIIKADSDSNTLLGEAGDDILFGGAGNDTLTGGTGSDTFTWEAPDLGTAAAPAEDVITDFHLGQGGDVIHLDDILPSDHGALDQYLALNFDNGDTTLEITPQVGGDITQKIRLEGVDMSVLGNTDAEIINNLINNGNLSLD